MFDYLFSNKIVFTLKDSIIHLIKKLDDQDVEIKEIKESLNQLNKKYELLHHDYESLLKRHNTTVIKRRI